MGGMFFDDLDDFSSKLEMDNKFFSNIFKDLGKNYRGKGGVRRAQKNKNGKGKRGMKIGMSEDDTDDMLTFFMMAAGGMPMGMPTKIGK